MHDTSGGKPALRDIDLIGIASNLGGPNPGTADGPDSLREALQVELRQTGLATRWRDTLHPEPGDAHAALAQLALQTAKRVAASIAEGNFPLVLGGDHSCAIGTWRGVLAAIGRRPFGLVWIDAHCDAHTPDTSPTGRLHGMPLAALLGHGRAPLVGPAGVLDPARVALVGVRSAEPEERALLARLGVRVFGMDDVRRDGLAAVLAAARAVACPDGQSPWGLSLDVDALDPREAPGVGVPAAGGLRPTELVAALRAWRGDALLQAFEIAEFDPQYDVDGRTARWIREIACALLAPSQQQLAALEARYGARNYDPLPVVLSRGKACWVWDLDGRRYLDMMSAYSAVSFGHSHPRLLRALAEQAERLAVPSRAFRNDRLPLMMARLCKATAMDRVLPMNTGAEAVETAIKAARKWAYTVKGVAADQAEIIVCAGNFHGRTSTIVGFSSEAQYRYGFGPFAPGFRHVPYGDAAALRAAIGPNTAAFLCEPVQGEAGIRVAPKGWLAECARICREARVLLICDEVQTGLGRTGKMLAAWHEGVRPDGVCLGKALGGGLLPVSAFLASEQVMGVFHPGDHGSTFGGNPLAAAVALEALAVLEEESLCERAAAMGAYLLERLRGLRHDAIVDVRGIGLLVGVELDPARAGARVVAERLLARGVLTKDTHDTVLRFAPPLVVERAQIDLAVDTLAEVLNEFSPPVARAA
ncbi:MAG: ornithine--oxo-acid transaminase [Rhodocyclaceae bacterium]|nr:ornithine--oxo-acid transaminase [Rhodocyclaceae bacterium]